MDPRAAIRGRALALGFDAVGFTTPALSEAARRDLGEYLARGHHGDMGWLVEKAGLDFHYGLASWTECAPPAVNCPVISSPGAFGFTPWVDREDGYYAIIGMEVDESLRIVTYP